jgi:sugar O-acyltransferase (sialic acid O-acetyltransferase NeuD family)
MNMNKSITVLGAGGHAKVIISTLIAANITISRILDDNPDKWGSRVFDIKITGPFSEMDPGNTERAVIAIGDNKTRKRISERFQHVRWMTAVIHPDAYVHPTVRLGRGTVVFAKAVVQPDTVIGDHCIINTGATIDHDCRIGNYVHIAPGVNLAGEVCLEEGVFCGIGGKAITGITVGRWSTVGAGSVVIKDLPEYSLAVGVPAKVVRIGQGRDKP